MFRRIENTMKADPSFPADLKQLGFFINDTGHIRLIDAPDKPHTYNATNSYDRHSAIMKYREKSPKHYKSINEFSGFES